MKALVCGGAGYIGSHMVRALMQRGFEILVVDDLSTGHVESLDGVDIARVSLQDQAAIDQTISRWKPDVVFHFAASSIVRDSVADPLAYYRNNVTGTINLLEAMRRHDIAKMIFSSTAAVYGLPLVETIDESQPLRPINPYGSSKMIVEGLLAQAYRAYNIRSVSLRYFNAAGAAPDGRIGEAHDPETHLVPNAIRAALLGAPLTVFGNDYATDDGTCVRDYVHVCDLADAHLLACDYLGRQSGAYSFNLGTGRGCSVMDIVKVVGRATGSLPRVVIEPRREGDPDRLVASPLLAMHELGWRPVMSDLETIVGTAARWHAHPRY
ncbi:MAG: UDP-glucose 4-epimerase GalE [Luteibacter sp.]|uniref:UDP-glucose 4-epimerase GalE n=1 Tax=Rhodanobacteraceae TaxID=1775411 RepID=UPI0008856C02|nr:MULTISPECIES: UDP-glucose 4-epimerase GalE [Rhodanobacteraceae]MDQ7997148.1 UDP-glucose 4-epimerase GalE [Luteibacter sp.]MDQ8049798.1 UDP-glucose 4-epimerase GalE [Luteibacter sp.]SDG78840.1 UDP-galactose 4-epimerase [Dyella sp. 333MFSha]